MSITLNSLLINKEKRMAQDAMRRVGPGGKKKKKKMDKGTNGETKFRRLSPVLSLSCCYCCYSESTPPSRVSSEGGGRRVVGKEKGTPLRLAFRAREGVVVPFGCDGRTIYI
jgi:hypothetical protein